MRPLNDNLPLNAFADTVAPIPLVGGRAEQIALQDRGWEMLESYSTPAETVGTRLANAWLGERRWSVQIVPHHLMKQDDWVRPLCSAARLRRFTSLIGASVDPQARPAAVWRVPMDVDSVGRFFEGLAYVFHMLFPEDRSFAIHANEGDFAVYAGPEPFLRAALPSASIGHHATVAVKHGLEQEHGEGFLDTILAHYAPFMLEN